MSDEPKVIFTARSSSEATIVANFFQQEGIEARVSGGETAGGAFDIIETDPEVLVPAKDFEAAVGLLEEFKKELEEGVDLDAMSDAEGQFDWPMCPICDELRYAKCANCSTTGSEYSTEETDGQSVITCMTCKEPTSIEWQAKCKYCEHDFASDEGTSNNDGSARPCPEPIGADSSRVMIVVGVLVLLGIAIAVAFSMGGN